MYSFQMKIVERCYFICVIEFLSKVELEFWYLLIVYLKTRGALLYNIQQHYTVKYGAAIEHFRFCREK